MDEIKLAELIRREKQERDTVILAHTYQSPAIIDVSDITGDSYALSVAASKILQKRVILCGVRFMADTVKILSPEKTVILPKPEASCPMAVQTSPEEILKYKEQNPGTCVVAYVNTSTELKAVCDVCVTSSTAVKIVENIEADKILFVPDKNLGSYVKAKVPGKDIELWSGCCPVHDSVTEQDILALKDKHPDAKFAVHPECREEVVKHADLVGSTSAIIDYIKAHDNNKEIIVGTEGGVAEYITEKNPEKSLIQLCPDKLMCPDMKMTSLEDVYKALIGKGGEEIEIDENLRLAAKRSIDNMIKYGG